MSFQIRPENQSASLPYSGVRPPSWQHQQSINLTGEFEGLKNVATSWSLGNWEWITQWWNEPWEHQCHVPPMSCATSVMCHQCHVPPMSCATSVMCHQCQVPLMSCATYVVYGVPASPLKIVTVLSNLAGTCTRPVVLCNCLISQWQPCCTFVPGHCQCFRIIAHKLTPLVCDSSGIFTHEYFILNHTVKAYRQLININDTTHKPYTIFKCFKHTFYAVEYEL